ncbi:E3 ubiquitin-protein ligase ZSWIM2 [Emys orbicularis]|uniref:E3 ubiquitin-protein ligase ZSWIM2 n=1 Tax=Emys orbicularis TaxID=82168 RepID=UPI0031FCC0DF
MGTGINGRASVAAAAVLAPPPAPSRDPAMSRRRCASAGLSWQQDQALGSTMRIVRELGPTGFVLQEEGGPAHRVFLGEPHSCTCATFLREKDLCSHICWILLKKFKIPRNHEYAFQLGLLEGEINDILQQLQQEQTLPPRANTLSTKTLQKEDDGYINQKEIDAEDVCPICQEELLKKMFPITYCRYGCGNNVHITCMKIWADHQGELESDSVVKCPLCREEFAPLKLILEEFRNSTQLVTAAEKVRLDKHLGLPCNNCRAFPIEGKCYKCTECSEYHLCHECFTSFCHPPHVFTFRQKRNQKWRSLDQVSQLSTSGGNLKSVNPGDNSKEEMLHLQEKSSCIPKHIVKSLPLMLIRKCSNFLAPGLQCRLCLKIFCLGQYGRLLPCNHKFHRECIDNWLLHQKNACPIDGYIVYNPLTWKDISANRDVNQPGSQTNTTKLAKQMKPELFIPGIGLFFKQTLLGHPLEKSQDSLQRLHNNKDPPHSQQGLILNGISYFHLGDSDSSQHSIDRNLNLQFSRHGKDLAHKPFQKILSQKSYSVTSRKDAISNGTRGLNGTCTNKEKGAKVCYDHANPNKVVSFEDRNNHEISACVRFPGKLNFEDNLGGTIDYTFPKRDSKCVGKARQQRRLLARPPKHKPLSLKTTEVALLMEGIPLNNKS